MGPEQCRFGARNGESLGRYGCRMLVKCLEMKVYEGLVVFFGMNFKNDGVRFLRHFQLQIRCCRVQGPGQMDRYLPFGASGQPFGRCLFQRLSKGCTLGLMGFDL